MYEDDYHPTSTIIAFEEFMKSSMWRDMVDFLTSWREQARSKLEAATEPRDLYRLQGESLAYMKLLGLPEAIIEYMKQQHEGQGKERGHGYERTRV